MENLNKFFKSRHAGIFIFIWAFVFGVLFSSYINISSQIILLLFLIGVSIFITDFLRHNRISKEIFCISLLIISFVVGSVRYELKDRRDVNPQIESFVNQKAEIEGLVVDEPERKDNGTRIIVLPLNSKEKILVTTDLYSHVAYGDVIKVNGKLQKPGIIKGEDGRNFDYGKFLSKDDIYYTISFAKVEILSNGNGSKLKATLFHLKNIFIEKIKSILPEPESSLMAGLVLAGKESLPKNILDEFRRAGIVHIVVLSGYNISIVAEFLLKMFSFLSLRIAALSSVAGILLFTIMTGGTATIVRAAIMSLVMLLGKIIGRNYSASRALLVAAFLMLLENPKILVFDPSFKLSFLATLALIFVTPIFEKYLLWIKDMGDIRSMIATTLSTQIVVLPYLLYAMGNFSLVSIFSNLLILIFIPIVMLVGFLATLVAFISTTIAMPLTYAAHLILKWILFVASWFGNLSWASIEIGVFPIWITIIWAMIYFYLYFYFKNKKVEVIS